MLKIFQPPESFSFGLEDRFNTKMVQALNDNGVRCVTKRLWPDFLARHLFFSNLPYACRLYLSFVAPFYCRMHLSTIYADDVVWINGPSLPITDIECWFEKQIIQCGVSYIFWLEDDYFSDPMLRPTAEVRMELARKQPLIVWGGRPWALKTLLMLNGVLERVYRDVPFTLRIITGSKKPKIDLSIPWEWMAYDRQKEAEYAAGAVAGLAPLEDTNFNSCKGNYKVKTYMALGVPPLTSPVGYNNHLIKHGETGFLSNSEMEWELALRTVLDDVSFAAKVGKAARAHIIGRYSYKALMPIWAKALQDAFPKKLANPHSTQPSYQG
jgi:glycosyltransferase involved in cell wall biosynthesis